jgi:hypothetical protein
MSKIKYTEEIKQKSIELRLEGKSNPEIIAITGMKHESLNKLFKERNIKLNEDQAAQARARRWLDHEPTKDGHKVCSKCGKNLSLDDFHNNKNRLSGKVSACKTCCGDFYEENAEEIKRRVREYKETNPDKRRETNENYYQENKEYHATKATKWAKENPERKREIERKYDRANQPKKNARTALYKARKKRATPPWLSQQQIDEIQRIYENCPAGYEVDHIVPLRGKKVSGLHVPWNLQYLTAEDNNKKGNRI